MDEESFMQIVRDQFSAMDSNQDGKLSKEEVHRFEKEIAPSLGQTYSEQDVDRKFAAMDTDENGFIERSEYIAYCRKEAGFDE